MDKLHLCLICGRDNRYNYIRHTVNQALPVFDTVHIMDTGSTDRTPDLKSQSPKINYFYWNRWERGWGDAYDCVRRDVPVGDWFLYLDSDELPSQYMLDHIRDSVQRIEKEGYGQARIPNVLHVDGRRVGDPAENLPRTPEEFSNRQCWTKSIICRNGPWLEVDNFGMHAQFCNIKQPLAYLPLYYCHHKHRSQVDATVSISSFLLPESYDIPPDSEENRALRLLARRFSINNPNQLIELLRQEPPEAFVELIAGWKEHPLATCRHWYSWYRAGFAVGGHPLLLCNEACCRYRQEPGSNANVSATSVPQLPEGWTLEKNGDYYLVGPRRNKSIKCNQTAALVLSQLDGSRSVAEIVYEISQIYPESAADVREHTLQLVEKLAADEVISLRAPVTEVSTAARRAIDDAVRSELGFWRRRGGWDAGQLRSRAEERGWVYVSFNGGTVRVFPPHDARRLDRILGPYLQHIALEAPDIDAGFAIDPDDHVRGDLEFPVLGFSNRGTDAASVLIPDVEFMGGHGELRKTIEDIARRVPWEDKLKRAVWRGSSTGQMNTGNNWRENLRVRLCLHSLVHPQSVDARLTSYVQCDEAAIRAMKNASIGGDYLDPQIQTLHKYVVNVDGNSASWTGTFWKLLSNSLMIQLEPEQLSSRESESATGSRLFRQWYHHWIQQGRHYLSCRLDQLEDLIQWAKEHDDECREIAENATVFANEYLTAEAGRLYTRELLRELSRLNK